MASRRPVNKKQKLNRESDDDTISEILPDFIVGHILSFLPTKEAVRTCVLSKRWKSMWTFITKLHFEDREPSFYKKIRKTHFQSFVYRVLSLSTSSIQSFSFSLSESHATRHVNKWISDALNRRVKELYINSKEKLNISSHSILETSSLEVLVLRIHGWAISVSTFVSLSHLTLLELSGITFTCHSEKLIFNLPVLRKYELENCTWLNVKGVTFEVPLLEVLSINHKPESISDESHTVIKFCCLRLREFSFKGCPLEGNILLDLDLSKAPIASANVHMVQYKEQSEEEMVLIACELLKQLNNNVECLKYEQSKTHLFRRGNIYPTNVLALPHLLEFGMLTRLELGTVAGKILLDFLVKTPFLKTLILKGILEYEELWNPPDNVPWCIIYNLQAVNFGKFDGHAHQLLLVKFVMENAQVLKRAKILSFVFGCIGCLKVVLLLILLSNGLPKKNYVSKELQRKMYMHGLRNKIPKYEGPDIISNLPDVIIGRILSFLSTKEAIRTCVLSSRWLYIWTFVTKLNFEDRERMNFNKIDKARFLKFVTRVLIHLKASSIESFSLYLQANYEPDWYVINMWISAMLNRGAKRLSIHSNKKLNIFFHSLVKFENLEELVLSMEYSAIKVPTFVCFSSLTVLELSGIMLTCDPYNDSQSLSLNLPVLRKYEMKNCTWLSIKCVNFKVPLLELIFIEHYHLKYLSSHSTSFQFCAPRLAQFSCSGYMPQHTILLDLDPSTTRVASANIDLREYHEECVEETALLAYKLVKHLNSNVESLNFKRSELLELARDSLVADSLKFEMLRHLELGKVSGDILWMFLISSPFLKTLFIVELVGFEEEVLDLELVPPSFKSNLEDVKFGRLNGDEHELLFAKYVMENAKGLVTANFSATWKLRKSNFEYVKKTIFSFKKGDRFVFMEFSTF